MNGPKDELPPAVTPARERLIVVSNRLPITIRRAGGRWRSGRSSGGLVSALAPVTKETEALWIGWPGDPPEAEDAARQELLERIEKRRSLAAVDLPRELASRFYPGYSNRGLWPVLHGFPSHFEYRRGDWEAYVEGNSRFCDTILERLRPGDRLWIHDYHLLLLPRMIREAAPDVPIGFFLHIPWPSTDAFKVLPHGDELLDGLLGADLIGFQTHRYLDHFRAALLRVLGVPSQMDGCEIGGRVVRLEVFPIGIVPEEIVAAMDSEIGQQRFADLRQRYGGRRLIVAVDRLDYTKGIPDRLRTFRFALDRDPGLRDNAVLVQIAVPSRERLGSYRRLGREVNELVGEINGAYATPSWTPVIYIRRSIPRAELAALYAAADVAWVASLRDGMNLVAKEYVACQRDHAGVLLLSEFAGAAAEMGEALLVNPWDVEQSAAALSRALALPLEERRERMEALRRRVVRNTAGAWSRRFLSSLSEAAVAQGARSRELPPPLEGEMVVTAYRAAEDRLLLLDYDGTLVPFANRPQDASPGSELLALLQRLTAETGNRVAIVSGRDAETLGRWFESVEGLWLAAEHGAVVRSPGAAGWTPLRPETDTHWKEPVRAVLEQFTDRTPGSLIEEKQYSLVWHYRMADAEFGPWLATELAATLREQLAETDLRAVPGHKTVEVRFAWAQKGAVLERLEAERAWDFRLACGDDRTDEDLFRRLAEDAFTIHVGEGPSRARFRVDAPSQLRRFLATLTA